MAEGREGSIVNIGSIQAAKVMPGRTHLRRSPPLIVSSLSAAVASTVGLLGLFLALMGIHGTVSYIVVLRTREVGIRMAIGAQKRDIFGLILRESTRPVLAGLVVGMFLAVGASYVLRRLLFGLNPVDSILFHRRLALVLGCRAACGVRAIAARSKRRSHGGAQIRMNLALLHGND